MLWKDFLVIALAGDRLRFLERLLRLDREFVDLHGTQRKARPGCGK
jgi:hypothetical protein